MDCALHRAGVTFVLDRAGVTGDDGASHNGMWDMSMLQVVPGLRLAAPRDEATLRRALRESIAVDDAPTVVRFPKGALGPSLPALRTWGDVDVLAESGSGEVLLVAVGAFAAMGIDVAERLRAQGIGVTVVDPRWVKPVPAGIPDLARTARLVVVLEDGIRTGGVGSAVSQRLQDERIVVPVRTVGIPERFLDHGKRSEVMAECGLTAQEISRSIVEAMAAETATESPNPEPMPRPAEGSDAP
jgi:1-deoxy-D-xylulose-5-phosphate synthase